MKERNPHNIPDFVDRVMDQLGYDSRVRRRWWMRDRVTLPAIICGVGGVVVVMGVLAILQTQPTPTSRKVAAGDAHAVGQAIRHTRTSIAQVDDALLRVLLAQPIASPTAEGVDDVEDVQSAPLSVPGAFLGGQEPWFGIEATTPEGDGYERVVALAPGQST